MAKQKKKIHMTTVEIGGLTYTIVAEECRKLKNKDLMVLGQIDFRNRRISLDIKKMFGDEEICYTLFHELIHGTIDATTYKKTVKDMQDDDFLQPFSRMLWGAIKDCGLLNTWWKKKPKKRG